jgi:cytochrome c553
MDTPRNTILAGLFAGALAGLAALALSAVATAGPAPDLEASRHTFASIRAACHGPTGRSDPENPTVKALDPQPADLSDPLFDRREPAEDWQIVVTHGG